MILTLAIKHLISEGRITQAEALDGCRNLAKLVGNLELVDCISQLERWNPALPARAATVSELQKVPVMNQRSDK